MAKSKKIPKSKIMEYDLRTLPRDQRPKPKTGQHGTKLKLIPEIINPDELEVLKAAKHLGGWNHVRDLATHIFPTKKPAEAKLRTRNAIRRMVRGGALSHHSELRATYKLTARGAKLIPLCKRAERKGVLGLDTIQRVKKIARKKPKRADVIRLDTHKKALKKSKSPPVEAEKAQG